MRRVSFQFQSPVEVEVTLGLYFVEGLTLWMGKGFSLGGKVKAELQSHHRLSGQRQHPRVISRSAGPREKQLWDFRSMCQALAYGGVCGEPQHEQRRW